MKLLLNCIQCIQLEARARRQRFEVTLRSKEGAVLLVHTDAPVAPGTCYEILLKGKWPTSGDGNYVGDIDYLQVSAPCSVVALDIQQEVDWRKSLGERGWEQ